MNKKFIALFSLTLFVALPFIAQGQLPDHPPIGQQPAFSLEALLLDVIDWAWKIFAAIAVVLFIWAGIMFLTAAGSEGQIANARKAVIWGSVGVAVALIGFSIVTIIQSALTL